MFAMSSFWSGISTKIVCPVSSKINSSLYVNEATGFDLNGPAATI